jgi:hypothetical protein
MIFCISGNSESFLLNSCPVKINQNMNKKNFFIPVIILAFFFNAIILNPLYGDFTPSADERSPKSSGRLFNW